MQLDARIRGALLGAIGGAAGTWVMGLMMEQMKRQAPKEDRATNQGEDDASISLVGRHYKKGEGATEALGRILYRTVKREKPSKETKAALSEAVHWSFGISMGALYGLVRAEEEDLDLSGGLVFGSAVWVFASELMVPMLGLAAAPTAVPMRQHIGHMVGHLVYGAITASVAQGLRGMALDEPDSNVVELTRPQSGAPSEQPLPLEDANRVNLTRFGGSL